MSAAVFDTDLLWRRRERAVRLGAPALFLLERAADDLAERLGLIRRAFARCVVAGAYEGTLSRRLAGVPGIEVVVSTERAPGLAARCPSPVIVTDAEALPIKRGSLDAVLSALAWTTVNDLPGLLAQARFALKPDGLLLASLLGPETLTELRSAFTAAEAEVERGASPRVAPFSDVRTLGTLLQRTGFALPVVDSDIVRVTYATPFDLMRDLRAMGATNALLDRRRSFLRRETLARMVAIYAERFAAPGGRITATFEIVTMTAWAPHPDQPRALRPGSATTRLADVLGPTGDGTP